MMLTTRPTRLDYSVKLVCANNFTGPACSVAKICLGRFKGFQFYSRFFVRIRSSGTIVGKEKLVRRQGSGGWIVVTRPAGGRFPGFMVKTATTQAGLTAAHE